MHLFQLRITFVLNQVAHLGFFSVCLVVIEDHEATG